MTKIGSTPPPPPYEPEKPKKVREQSKQHHTEETHQSKSSHSRKLQRFAKTQASELSAAKLVKTGMDTTSWSVPLPLRDQWNANSGYCGEASMIAAGMMNGQYCSQYDARLMDANPPGSGSEQDQLLLGQNDMDAASAMKLSYDAWPSKDHTSNDPKDYLAWIKSEVVQGHPVSMGVFANKDVFGDDFPKYDQEYDHIVSVSKIESNYTDGKYHDDDIIYFNDNGLYNNPPDPQKDTFHCTFKDFLKSRSGANFDSDPPVPYSLKNSGPNYGIAITGTVSNANTLPVSLTSSTQSEDPEMQDGETRPVTTAVTLTVTISDLIAGNTYTIYRFRNFNDVPVPPSTDYSKGEAITFTATGSTYSFPDTIQPDKNGATTVIYRAVPV